MWSLCARLVAANHFIALLSILPQLSAFGGKRGLQPIAVKLSRIALHRRRGAWLSTPSLLWINHSDAALHGLAVLGLAAAVRAVCGGAGACACLLLSNIVFLSFDPVFGLSMPWDCLLLEAGWIAALLPTPAAFTSFANLLVDPVPVHPAASWLIRWLLFRLMIGFGKMKFRGTSPSDALYVRDFMILQPMPSRLGWYAHCYLPFFVFRLLLKAMFFTECLAPWLLFVPGIGSLPTQFTAILFIGLMFGILLHGSFGHFNTLTFALSLPLVFPDSAPPLTSSPLSAYYDTPHGLLCSLALLFYLFTGLIHLPFTSGLSRSIPYFPQIDKWASPYRRALLSALRLLQPFRLVHSYGVFPPHTAPPLKIIPVVEGSDDGGQTWKRYRYRWMLSGADSVPCFCAPHQPRLDYRMFYEGLGTTPDNMMAGTLALHEPYALSRAGFCDRLMQRLLEGDGPVSRLFAYNPFEGGKPELVRMITICLEPTPKPPAYSFLWHDYWRETVLGPNRPPTKKAGAIWKHNKEWRHLFHTQPDVWSRFVDEPEVLHWDTLFYRRSCAEHCEANAPDGGGLAPRVATFSRPALAYDGIELEKFTLAFYTSGAFWRWFLPKAIELKDSDWRSLREAGRTLHTKDGESIWESEMILSRLSIQLAAKLAPFLWAPGWPNPTAPHPPEGSPAVSSWFDMMLVCHHIILSGKTEEAFKQNLADPEACIRRIWPPGVGTWNVVEAVKAELQTSKPSEPEAPPQPKGRARTSPKRGRAPPPSQQTNEMTLSVRSGAFMYILLWWPTFQWHATKFRLCQNLCAPWQLATPREGAGVLELVELLVKLVPAPGETVVGAGESYPKMKQGEDLLWRDESGRRIGFGSCTD